MSGWLSGKFGKLFWGKAHSVLPAGVKAAIKKGGDTFHEIDGEVPLPNRPAMPQAQVNQEFRKKEQRIRNQGFNKR